MKKIIFLVLLTLLLYSCNDDISDKTAITNSINTAQVEETISITEVEKHNKKWDCYTVLDWKVYDVSSFFGTHPGWDDNLLKTCWKDATTLFQWVHWNNAKAKMKKEEFYIWNLK